MNRGTISIVFRCLHILAIVFATGAAGYPARAGGPSFDCARAKTDDERTICGDPALAEQDRAVTEAYAVALAAAAGNEETAERLRDDQRKWLGWRDRCEYERKACLASAMTDRISLLKSLAADPGFAGHLRTAIVRGHPALIFAAYPMIEDGSSGADAFNGLMKKLVAAEVAEYRGAECTPNMTVCPGVDTIAELFLPAHGIVSVQVRTAGFYGVPRAHRIAFTFDLVRGRALTAEDVFVGKGWVRAIVAYCEKHVAEGFLGVKPISNTASLDNWRFEPDRAVVTLAYQGVDSPTYQEVPLPYRLLAPYLRPDSPVGLDAR